VRYIGDHFGHVGPSPDENGTGNVLELAILGLLKEQPLHGYELKKRLGETLGSLWGISYGSLYPALRRLERDGAIEIVAPEVTSVSIPSTGSLAGDLAAARARRPAKAPRRVRKAYRLTDRGERRLSELLLDDDSAGDDERAFAIRLAFCRHLEPDARLALLERRRAALADRLVRARRNGPGRGDRYARSLLEHRTQSIQRDLEWVETLVAAEGRDDASAPDHPKAPGRIPEEQGATTS
jgi:DNA-binding PadR family transcriptional regulator